MGNQFDAFDGTKARVVVEKQKETIHCNFPQNILVEKSINPETNRPYTYNIIEKAMREIHFAVNVNKGAKQQALDVIRRLKQVMPIIKASLTVRMIISTETSNAASTR